MTDNKLNVPDIIRGQVLKQGAGYLVRGQYVVGVNHGGWFWYDMYNSATGGERFDSAQTALERIALYIEAREKR